MLIYLNNMYIVYTHIHITHTSRHICLMDGWTDGIQVFIFNTEDKQRQTTIRILTHTERQLRVSNSPHLNIFGLSEEAGEPLENLH